MPVHTPPVYPILPMGFPEEFVNNGYLHAKLSPRIGLTVYTMGTYNAQLYPLTIYVDKRPIFQDYVDYVVGVANSVDPTRYPYLYDIADPLILKCLIIEALPIAEKLYANSALEVITSPRTGVV